MNIHKLLSPTVIDDLIQSAYFLAALLFIIGLKRMSSPKGARGGIVWAGLGMLIATLITFLSPGMHHFGLILAAILIGGIAAWWSACAGWPGASTSSASTCTSACPMATPASPR